MFGGGRASGAVSKFTAAAYAVLSAAPLLVGVAVCVLDVRPAHGLPSYARQTGQQCAACHNGFPELTPYGRLFKLNGYTFTGGNYPNWPPLAIMTIPNFTHVAQSQPGGLAPGFGDNNDFAFTGSLFYGGKIFDHVGAFIQGTYDQVPNTIHWDNTDIRYANTGQLSGHELVYGTSFNNNPTVNDVWNSTPAWGYPYVASQLAPTPVATTLDEGLLAQQVLGLNPYIYWNRLVYAEVGGYRTLSTWSLSALGIPPPGTSSIDGLAPSWRLAVEPAWGNNTWEVGTFGLAASLVPQRMTGAGTDHKTDVGFDTQYEFLGARDSFSLQARYILEYQDLSASQPLGLSSNSFNNLHSFHNKGTYYYKQMIGLTAGYFNIQGSSDPLLYGSVSANNSPNSAGEIFELDYIPFNYGGPAFWPWLNMKLGVQYIRHNKFDGASTNYDGMGTNASANNTVFVFAWFAF
jgi:hypothetical protein